MLTKNPFLYFLTLLLFKQRGKHIGVVLISVVIIFLLSAVLFLSSSIQESTEATLQAQPDMILTKLQAGRATNTPTEWIEKVATISGVSRVTARVHGRYYPIPKEQSFLIVGIDFFEEQNQKDIATLLGDLNLKEFFATDSMLIGDGVRAYMSQHFYKDSFSFKLPNGGFKKVHIYETLPSQSNLIANDMIIIPIDVAREIFGMSENEVSDISFDIPNDSEWDMVQTKLHLLFYDLRVIDKREIRKAYTTLYNYKGGFFLILYMITIVTFMLILYQRYSMVYSSERKEIGVLRAIGWSISDVLKLKFFETLIVVVTAFILGVVLAYIYVFICQAPLLREIFLGGANLYNSVTFLPTLKFGVLSSIFLLYAISFLVAVLVPVWRIAITPPKEAML